MNYKSVAMLNEDLRKWIGHLPRDIELIVGVPRSGLLAANLLALHANLPLTDVDGLLSGRLLRSGARQRQGAVRDFLSVSRKVLVLDDSVGSGSSMAKERLLIETARTPHRIQYGAVYVTPAQRHAVHFHCQAIPFPRVFEWNLMHHECLGNSCLDIDGVLCVDPTEQQNDDGPRYREFLRDARPLIVPSVIVGWLVTCRLEKYRGLTEEWLARHGVRYQKLVMLDLPDRAARVLANSHASFKADVYRQSGADLFIESSHHQAAEIARLTGFSVLCTDTGEMFNAGSERPEERDRFLRFAPEVADEISRIIPADAEVALVDDAHLLGSYVPTSARIHPFIEHHGQYWGPPADDFHAIRELDRMRMDQKVKFLIFAWPAFWWLDHYAAFADHLQTHYRCIVRNERLVIFDLRDPALRSGIPTTGQP